MVDAIVSYVLERVGDYLIQEAVSFSGRKKDVEWLKNELEWMQSFIEDVEEKQVNDRMVRKWISDVRDIAYDVEDVLDTFILKVHDGETSSMLQVDGVETSERRPGLFTSIKKSFRTSDQESSHKNSKKFIKRKVDTRSIGKQIDGLKEKIIDLDQKRQRYGIQNIVNNQEGKSYVAFDRLNQVRRVASYALEENVVGFEDDANELLAKLLDNRQEHFVISIFGMGGLGKTTLAKKLYHSNDVKNSFDRCAWVSVSQDYNIRDLLLRIIESFNIKTKEQMKEIVKMSEEQLEQDLYGSLEGCKYLVVLDDVWQKEAWQSLKRAFPKNMNHSRVIITTREKEVAERSDDSIHARELHFLTPEESWNLFCKKAFANSNPDKGSEELGREMVKKCGGLPLAIVVLGGLLSTKKPHQWGAIRDQIWRHMKNDSILISNLLSLSFNDLPYRLKLCFLYLSLFPEGYEINIEKLIRLLVAEGFIPEDGGQIMEEVAQSYVNNLINRNLVQIGRTSWGTIITCRVHDLLRELTIQKARELNLFYICDDSSTRSSIPSSCRRQAIYSESERFLWLQYCHPLSRSLIFFNQRSDQLKHLSTKFRFLRVLEVKVLNSLPKEIGKLVHLIHLGLTFSDDCKIPAFIGKLKRLQTLDMGSTYSRFTLPTEISKLQELRHLIGFFTEHLPIANLENLLTLRYVYLESWVEINPKRLVNLRELQIQVSTSTQSRAFSLDSVAKLVSLRLLSVWLGHAFSFSSVEALGHCRNLVDLRLNGKIEKLPINLDELLPNLEGLKLANSLLKADSMPSLEKLPNLRFLVLCNNFFIEKKLIFRANGFPRLEVLQFLNWRRRKSEWQFEWQVEKDAMPMLRGLSIDGFDKKLKIPARLRSIPRPGNWELVDKVRGHLSLKLL